MNRITNEKPIHSIYNYPEHLNPFYEAENHKRLRFWKLGNKKSEHSDGSRKRSNSFNLDGLKDMWAFKSFRLKKKSSTLGINKTSESPPQLRHAFNTNSGQRHTMEVGVINGNSFERGASTRTSLQDMNRYCESPNNQFLRNNRYRSTIQVGSGSMNRYDNQSRSVTPTPQSKYITNGLRNGTSLVSVNSTNPFDEDDDGVSVTGSMSGDSRISKTPRKKRRAPPPPILAEKPTILVTQPSQETSVERDEISQLSTQIQSFVQSTEDEIIESSSTNITSNFTNAEINKNDDELKAIKQLENEHNREIIEQTKLFIAELIADAEKQANDRPHPMKPIEPPIDETKLELKIVESVEDISNVIKETPIKNNEVRDFPLKSLYKTTTIRISPTSPMPTRRVIVKESVVGETTLIGHSNENIAVPYRRKSVKDIIESINRSQSLLKVDRDSNSLNSVLIQTHSDDSLKRNLNQLEESEKEIKKIIEEMESTPPPDDGKTFNEYPLVLKRLEAQNNESDDDVVFRKCTVQTDRDRLMNSRPSHEWNPVPKPRRSRNSLENSG